MNTPQTVVEQQTAQKTRVGRSILLGLSVSVAAFIFFGFNAAMLLGGNEGGGGGGTVPMKVRRIISGAYVSGSWLRPSIEIYGIVGSGAHRFGRIDSTFGFYPAGTTALPSQLYLVLDGSHAEVTVSLQREDGKYITVCVGENRTVRDPAVYTYYVNYNGDTYLDKALTQKANTAACDQVHARALTVNQVTGATVSEPFGVSSVIMNFVHDRRVAMGSFDIVNSVFVPAATLPPTLPLTTPLQIDLWRSASTEVTVPARYMTITYGAGVLAPNTQTLCVPETVVGGTRVHPPHDSSYLASYFYDTLGNPYVDSHLSQAVPCNPPIPTSAVQTGDPLTPPADAPTLE